MDSYLEGQLSLPKENLDVPHLSPDRKYVSEKVVEVTDDYDSNEVLQDERDIVTRVLSVDDDPTLSPWTLRAFVIAIGLSVFAGALGKHLTRGLHLFTQRFSTAEIYYFKPVSTLVKLDVTCKPCSLTLPKAINRCLYFGPWYHQLHHRNSNGSCRTPLWMVPLSEPSMCFFLLLLYMP